MKGRGKGGVGGAGDLNRLPLSGKKRPNVTAQERTDYYNSLNMREGFEVWMKTRQPGEDVIMRLRNWLTKQGDDPVKRYGAALQIKRWMEKNVHLW